MQHGKKEVKEEPATPAKASANQEDRKGDWKSGSDEQGQKQRFRNRGGPNRRRPPGAGSFNKPDNSNMGSWRGDGSGGGDQSLQDQMSSSTTDLEPKEGGDQRKKFTGRCRLFVGNLTSETDDEAFRAMFTQFGEISEVFLNSGKGFGFLKMDTRQNADAAKAALHGTTLHGRVLRVRFASHGAALKVRNLSQFVSNELLEEAFSIFGEVERTVVIVDDRGRPLGEGIVEFSRKPTAQMALKRCSEGCFLICSSPRPVIVESLEFKDEEDGLLEKDIPKNNQYVKERESGPRFAPPGSFEFDFATRWKKLYQIEKQKKDLLEKEMQEEREHLEEQLEFAIYEYETNMLREKLRQREQDAMNLLRMSEMRRREQERRQEEMRRQQQGNMGMMGRNEDMRGGPGMGRNDEMRGGPGMGRNDDMRGPGMGRNDDMRGPQGMGRNEEMRGGPGIGRNDEMRGPGIGRNDDMRAPGMGRNEEMRGGAGMGRNEEMRGGAGMGRNEEMRGPGMGRNDEMRGGPGIGRNEDMRQQGPNRMPGGSRFNQNKGDSGEGPFANQADQETREREQDSEALKLRENEMRRMEQDLHQKDLQRRQQGQHGNQNQGPEGVCREDETRHLKEADKAASGAGLSELLNQLPRLIESTKPKKGADQYPQDAAGAEPPGRQMQSGGGGKTGGANVQADVASPNKGGGYYGSNVDGCERMGGGEQRQGPGQQQRNAPMPPHQLLSRFDVGASQGAGMLGPAPMGHGIMGASPGNDMRGGPGNDMRGGPGNDMRGGPGNDMRGGPGNHMRGGPGNDMHGGMGRMMDRQDYRDEYYGDIKRRRF